MFHNLVPLIKHSATQVTLPTVYTLVVVVTASPDEYAQDMIDANVLHLIKPLLSKSNNEELFHASIFYFWSFALKAAKDKDNIRLQAITDVGINHIIAKSLGHEDREIKLAHSLLINE